MSAKRVDIIQNTPSWLKWRLSGLGASDHSAIQGLSPYKTARDLWFEKAGFGDADEDESKEFIYKQGHIAEDELRSLLSKYTSKEFKPACFQKDEIFLASLDGYENGEIMEAKLVGKDALKQANDGVIPPHHNIQVQAQLYTSESDKAFWIGKAPKVKRGVVVEIGRNEKLIKKIAKDALKFWESIQKGEPPALQPGDTLFLTSPEQVELFKKLTEVKKQKVELEALYSELEKKAKALATHTKVRCGNVSITTYEAAGRINYKDIPEVKALKKSYLEKFRSKPSKQMMMKVRL